MSSLLWYGCMDIRKSCKRSCKEVDVSAQCYFCPCIHSYNSKMMGGGGNWARGDIPLSLPLYDTLPTKAHAPTHAPTHLIRLYPHSYAPTQTCIPILPICTRTQHAPTHAPTHLIRLYPNSYAPTQTTHAYHTHTHTNMQAHIACDSLHYRFYHHNPFTMLSFTTYLNLYYSLLRLIIIWKFVHCQQFIVKTNIT